MAEQKLPDLEKSPSERAGTETAVREVPPVFESTINMKDVVIAFGAVLVAAIALVFIKNYLSKMLVAIYKKSPRAADSAAWSVFCILLLAAIAGVLGILDSTRLLSLPYLIVIGLAMLVSLVTFTVAITSKR